jgi:hypothetical protein
MKRIRWISFGICLILTVSFLSWGHAAQRAPVPAEAKWMVHFDMAKFRLSHLHDFLMEESFTRPFRKWNARLEREVNMDVIRDMEAVTLFNTGTDEDSIVACFRGKIDKDFLMGKIKEETDYEEIPFGDFNMIRWDRREYAVFAAEDLVLYSSDRWAIEQALKTMTGGQRELSDSGVPAAVPKEAIAYAYMKSPKKILGLPSKSKFADKIGAVLYHVSEVGDMVHSYLKMETMSKADAESLRDIFKGLIAVARLQAPEDFEEVKFLDRVRMNITGNTLEIEMEAPAGEIFEMLRHRMKLAGLIPAGTF